MREYAGRRCQPAILICCALAVGTTQSSDAISEERTTPSDLKMPVRITGRVINEEDSQPVPGADVFVLLLAENGRRVSLKETTSDANGDFAHETSKSGRSLVWANHGKRTSRPKSLDGVKVVVGADGTPPEPIELRVRPAASVRVNVSDKADGRPLRSAVVHLEWSYLADFKTNLRGEALVEPLPGKDGSSRSWPTAMPSKRAG